MSPDSPVPLSRRYLRAMSLPNTDPSGASSCTMLPDATIITADITMAVIMAMTIPILFFTLFTAPYHSNL
jgi:hypothetical protein